MPVRAGAGDDGEPILIGGFYPDVKSMTDLIMDTEYTSLLRLRAPTRALTAYGGLNAIWASSSEGVAVDAYSTSGTAVRADSDAIGVYGETRGYAAVWGNAVPQESSPDARESYGVYGSTGLRNGRGVFGWNTSTTTGTGVFGQTDGANAVAVRGYAWDGPAASGNFGTGVLGSSGSHAFPPPAPRPNTGVMGVSAGGTGVYGRGGVGRGGVFAGEKAQVRLVPSTAGTHPATGSAGDLVVDQTGRLWYCKGGSTWRRLA